MSTYFRTGQNYKVKKPAFSGFFCDPGRTRTPTPRTGIWDSIQLNYGTLK